MSAAFYESSCLATVRPKDGAEGLTTLEWLLVVATVAGLAALGVVLVQNVVDDNARQLGSNDARQTAAELAAEELQRRWRDEVPTARSVDGINQRYAVRCRHLRIVYPDIDLEVQPPKPGALDSAGIGWDPSRLPACTFA